MSQSRITLPLQRGTLTIDRAQFGAALLSGRNVLAVGRITNRPACDNCRGFQTAMIRNGNQLIPAHCTQCVTVPQQNGR